MKAATIDALGPARAIHVRDVPVPEPAADEVLVRVRSGSVNHVDTFVRGGSWRTPMAFPFVVGRDAVGSVVRCGSAVAEAFPVGAQVWTNSLGYEGRDGALAEYVRVPAGRLYLRPDGVDDASMAALCHPAVTAWLALFHHGHLRSGERVLIVGGAGNVGWSATHLAVQAGAVVHATASVDDHAALRGAGAVPVLSRVPIDLALLGGPVDLVVDAAGSNELEQLVPALRPGGRIVLLAGARPSSTLPVQTFYRLGATITGFTISQASEQELAEGARHVNDAVGRTGLRPRRVLSVPLAEVAEAHDLVETGRIRGKVVVEVAPAETDPPVGPAPT